MSTKYLAILAGVLLVAGAALGAVVISQRVTSLQKVKSQSEAPGQVEKSAPQVSPLLPVPKTEDGKSKYLPVKLSKVMNYSSVFENVYVETEGKVVGLDYDQDGGDILLVDDSSNYLLVAICHACMQLHPELSSLKKGSLVRVKGVASFMAPSDSNLEKRYGLNFKLPMRIGMLELQESPIEILSSNTSDWQTYLNEKYGFEVKYPASFVIGRDKLSSQDFDGLEEGSLFTASFPESYEAGTNLDVASVFVGAKRFDQQTCFNKLYGGDVVSTAITQNNIQFQRSDFGEGAMGRSYLTYRYSTTRSNLCYELLLVVSSKNDLADYNSSNPNSRIPEYDQTKLDKVFDQILATFKFIK